MAHPLDMLTADEITRAVEVLRATGRVGDEALFAHVVLHEPTKDELARWKAGDPIEREVRAQIVPGPGLTLVEAVVSVTRGEVHEWHEVEGMRPALLMTEALNAIATTKEHPEYLAALARRGITDLDAVQIDPWPAGTFGYDCEDGRRIARCISFLRADATDNGYARPIEGVIVHFDLGSNEVLEVIDHGVVPLPPNRAQLLRRGSAGAAHRPQADLDHRSPTARASRSTATSCAGRTGSSGSSFDPYEGLVLHQVAYEDDGRRSPGAPPGVDRRDGRARTATRARCTAGRTRSTPASGASAA